MPPEKGFGRTPRAVAAWALERFDRAHEGVADFLARIGPTLEMRPEDARLLRDLAMGALKRRITLDMILSAFLAPRPIGGLRPTALRPFLEIGLYQSLYSERVPGYAAVDETVEAAKARCGPRGAGVVNAVLRRVLAELLPPGTPDGPPERTLPRDGRPPAVFARDVLPAAPEGSPERLAAIHAMPLFLVRRWVARWEAAGAEGILRASNRTPETGIRVNLERTTRETLLDAFARNDIQAEAGKEPAAARITSSVPFTLLRPFERGEFSIQDETAQSVAPLVRPKDGDLILEVGAGPGGKATHLAELSGGRAKIYALDLRPERLALLARNAARLGLRRIQPVAADGLHPPFARGTYFTQVLLDAPCSNSGVLARRPEARHRISDASIRRAAARQKTLLASCARLVRRGGALVYSTCSIEPEENEDIVRAFLAKNQAFALAEERLTLPSATHDGGYAARMERKAREE